MKSRIISVCLCLVALGLSMLMTVKLINSDGYVPPEKHNENKNDKTDIGSLAPSVNTEVELNNEAIASFAHTVESFVDRMAYSADKSYEAELDNVIKNLDRISKHLAEDSAGDKDVAEYLDALSSAFKTARDGFSGDSDFSAKVSDILGDLESRALLLDDSSKLYPRIDTAASGKMTLALLSMYERQSIPKDGTAFTVTVGGGALLGDELGTSESMKFATQFKNSKYAYPFHAISAVTASDDMTFISLEAPLTTATDSESTNPVKGAPEYAANLIGIDAVSLASSRVMEYGQIGFDETIKSLKDNSPAGSDILYSVQTSSQSKVTDFGKIVYITFDLTDTPVTDEQKEINKQVIKNAVTNERENGADVVIALLHWNTRQRKGETDDYLGAATSEYEAHFDAYNKEIARAAIGDGKSGADLVVGYGARVAQGIEKRNNKMIVYNPGDLTYSGSLDPEKKNTDLAFLFRQTFVKDSVGVTSVSYRIIPIVNTTEEDKYLPQPVFDERADKVIDNLIYQSRYFGDNSITSFNYIKIEK